MKPNGTTTQVCESATTCAQCNGGAKLCGDGVHFGTDVNTLYTCTGGMLVSPQACAFGCSLTPTPRCRDLVPSNNALAHLAGDTFSCTNPSPSPVGTLTGSIIDIDTTNLVVSPSPSPANLVKFDGTYTVATTNLVVLHVRGNFALNAGQTMTVHGSRGLVMLVDGTVTMSGNVSNRAIINLAANHDTAGPGGLAAAAGESGTLQSGAGGGGHDTVGGGGGGGGTGTAGSGGPAYGPSFSLQAGTAGGTNTALGVLGGGGGGALQISACGNVSIGANVLVNASGGGGRHGVTTSGAGGGGSGGAILIEGPSLGASVDGELVCNGGGGGQGAGTSSDDGANWDPSSAVTSPAPGGNNTGAGPGGKGGDGAAGTTPSPSPSPGAGGGGGGGAAGRIFLLNGPLSTAPSANSCSPQASTGSATTNP